MTYAITLGLLAALYLAPADAASPAESAAHRVLERVIGPSAAAQVSMTLTAAASDSAGAVEAFVISGSPGNIAIEATTPSALTQGAGWYLKYVAHADLVLRGANPVLPIELPAPADPIRRTASVPHRYALNDTNAGYTDPHLPWEAWENQLDLMALHGINEIHITVGTDYVYYLLLQRYGYNDEELRRWIPDPAHQPWWILQNLSGGDAPISLELLQKRAALGRRIADRARELGIRPVFPGYWGTVPADFATRNTDADVIPQGTWYGYPRPGWLSPATPLFDRVAADYYAIGDEVLGASTLYKMDPLHEGGLLGDANLTRSATAIERALQTAHPGATWVILGWMQNPSQALLDGIDKSRLLLLAAESDTHPNWDSAQRWAGVPYALGAIFNFGGHTIIGANATTLADRWFADLAGPNAARLKGIAIFAEAWTANPVVIELLSELPWLPTRFDFNEWMRDYAIGRYGTSDPHVLNAWSILAKTAYATPPDGNSEAQDSLFNALPSLTATTVLCCTYGRMRYSGYALETAWKELLAAAPSVTQSAPYRFDLADLTRQVIVNRARVLLPLIRRAYDRRERTQLASLETRWLTLMELADRVEGTHVAFMLGPRLDNARALGSTPAEQAQLVRNAINLITNWGTRPGFDSGLRDFANRDWNCLTRTYYMRRWMLLFESLERELAGDGAAAIDWYQFGDDFASADHSACTSEPSGDIVQMAFEAETLLAAGPDASRVPDDWWSFADNDTIFDYDGGTYSIDTAGADVWQNVNRYGVLYQPSALRDGGSATVRIASVRSEGARVGARAGIMAATNVVSAHPYGFVNIAITPDGGCLFSWASDWITGLDRFALKTVAGASWVRLARVGNAYVGSCSADGLTWTIVGSAVPDGLSRAADVGMFASAVNEGGSDRLTARFDNWSLAAGEASANEQIAVEYFHAEYGHYFVTAFADEIAQLDAGVHSGWARTGQAFAVYASPSAGFVPVCRFSSTAFPPKTTHFYAPRGLGCEAVFADTDWRFEGDAFYTPLPDVNGRCPSGTSPIYRLYNDGQGGAPNHRFTLSPSIRAQMLAQGYVAEGVGIGVGMCSPDDPID